MRASTVDSPQSTAKTISSFMGGLIFLWTVVCGLSTALAVEVEPMRLERTIPANRPSQGILEITNRAPTPVQVRIQPSRYRFSQAALKLNLPSSQAWFTFEPDLFTLAPGTSSSVTYTITPPANVMQDTAGEYLAAILVDTHPAEKSEIEGGSQSRITIVPRLALPVYLKIQGRELVEVSIVKVTASTSSSGTLPQQDSAPMLLKVETTLRNRGSVHVRPFGSLAIFDAAGSVVRARPFGKPAPLLPRASIKIPALFPLPPSGYYKAVVTIEPEEGALLQEEISFVVTTDGAVLSGE